MAVDTPVLFLIFNRPESTHRVFQEIRRARPSRLFISADGPRPSRENDAALCEATRAVIKQVDWDCELHTLLRDENLGCRVGVSSGIDWFFQNVEQGIVLEDDCLPSQSFFWFCQEMLSRYRDDERVMQISGSNFTSGRRTGRASYYFSYLNDIWGWATWRRAWCHFDLAMTGYPAFKASNDLARQVASRQIAAWLFRYFDAAYQGRDNAWSSQWAYAILRRGGLTVVPNTNLVTNIGFGEGATSATDERWRVYEQAASDADLGELVHPELVAPDLEADRLRFEVIRRTDPRARAPLPLPIRKARSALRRLKRLSGA